MTFGGKERIGKGRFASVTPECEDCGELIVTGNHRKARYCKPCFRKRYGAR